MTSELANYSDTNSFFFEWVKLGGTNQETELVFTFLFEISTHDCESSLQE